MDYRRWQGPDDPAWLTAPTDLRVMDATVLRQAGIPEPLIELATRDRLADSARAERAHQYQGIPFDDTDECEPDPLACYDRDYRRW
jgi:hypothetical protein